MGSRVGRFVVRAQIGLDLDNPTRQHSSASPMGEYLAEQARSHVLRRRFTEGARKQAAGKASRSHGQLDQPPQLLQKPLRRQMIVVPVSQLKMLLRHFERFSDPLALEIRNCEIEIRIV